MKKAGCRFLLPLANAPARCLRMIRDAIVHGNNLDALRQLADGSIDCVITSPPYDNARTYGSVPAGMMDIGKEIQRVLNPGAFCILILHETSKRYRRSGSVALVQVVWRLLLGFQYWETIIWHKQGGVPRGTHPKALPRFACDHEYILCFFKGDSSTKPKPVNVEALRVPTIYAGWKRKTAIRKKDGSQVTQMIAVGDTRTRGTVWQIPTSAHEVSANPEKFTHSATMPETLADALITAFTNPGETVLDPYCGSGTVCRVAKRIGRTFIGIDADYSAATLSASQVGLSEIVLATVSGFQSSQFVRPNLTRERGRTMLELSPDQKSVRVVFTSDDDAFIGLLGYLKENKLVDPKKLVIDDDYKQAYTEQPVTVDLLLQIMNQAPKEKRARGTRRSGGTRTLKPLTPEQEKAKARLEALKARIDSGDDTLAKDDTAFVVDAYNQDSTTRVYKPKGIGSSQVQAFIKKHRAMKK